MKRFLMASAIALVSMLQAASVGAESPLPSFDKDAVKTNPYNRTGQQEVALEKDRLEMGKGVYRPGNTGSEENPAFFVKKIKLTGFELPDKLGKLQKLLEGYTNRSLKQEDMSDLVAAVTEYAHNAGFVVAQAVVPPQEIKRGELEVKVYVAKYDKITFAENKSKVADRVIQNHAKPLKSGDVITTRKLESVLNYLNDLPGVIARGVLSPGSEPGTTSLELQTERRPVWNNYVFVDNGGSYYSGRWRYGVHTELKNLGEVGDKFNFTGYVTNNDTQNFAISYDLPVGRHGTRWGLGYSRTSYDMDRFGAYTPSGTSSAWSFYGLTPIYRDKSKRVYALYGYDYRRIHDDYELSPEWRSLGYGNFSNHKDANVLHAGVTFSEYLPRLFTSGDIIYWYGDLHTKDNVNSNDGAYHKLTADFKHVRYWKKWNARIQGHAQIANRSLDGSERFYLGGMNGVRAYPASETSGDNGYSATLEVRHATDTKGLEIAAYLDAGEVTRNKDFTNDHRNLAGWGVGLVYEKPNDWFARFDYARKIHPQVNESEPCNHNGRMWLQVYKMF